MSANKTKTGAPDWLHIHRGDAPLIVAMPHTGTRLAEVSPPFISDWLARRDADWHIERLYGFAADLGATLIRTDISRGVVDVNRDPSGTSLYPGQATTELCPTTTFDGEGLYGDTGPAALGPDEHEIARRRATWFMPYHEALSAELERLRKRHAAIVLYDAHSIRSTIPRLFEGELPEFNIGTDGGTTCDPALAEAVTAICEASGRSTVVNERFRGGWTTRHYGQPKDGVHAIQMELAMRGYLDEPAPPAQPSHDNWPPIFDPERAEPMQEILRELLSACLAFAGAQAD